MHHHDLTKLVLSPIYKYQDMMVLCCSLPMEGATNIRFFRFPLQLQYLSIPSRIYKKPANNKFPTILDDFFNQDLLGLNGKPYHWGGG